LHLASIPGGCNPREDEMIVCYVNRCNYCRSVIVAGQRWVREKIHDPALNGRQPSYTATISELFAGQEVDGTGNCPNHSLRRLERMLRTIGGKAMFLSSFDILRKDRRGKPILLAVVGDLETARLRLSQLALLMPGEYFVFDTRTHQIVAAMNHWASSRSDDLESSRANVAAKEKENKKMTQRMPRR
jgi:hypothetical protein